MIDNEALAAEVERQQRTIIEQGRKLREIVNLIRGEPAEGTAHSTHDAVELVRGLEMHISLYAIAADHEIAALKRAAAEQDAARYRLLRRGQHWSVIDGLGNDLRAEALDAAADAAMRKEGGG